MSIDSNNDLGGIGIMAFVLPVLSKVEGTPFDP
jgi:hypothetical protein